MPPITIETEYLQSPTPPPDMIKSLLSQQAETDEGRYALPITLLDELIRDKLCSKADGLPTIPTSPTMETKKESANDQLKKQDEKLNRLTATIDGFVSDARAKEHDAKYRVALEKAMEEGIEEGWKKGQAHTLLEVEMERKERELGKQRAIFTAAGGYPNSGLVTPNAGGGMVSYPSNFIPGIQNQLYGYSPPMLAAPDPTVNMYNAYPSGYPRTQAQMHTRTPGSESTNSNTARYLHLKLDEGFDSLGSHIEELAEDGRARHRDIRQEMRRGFGKIGSGLDKVGYGVERLGYGLERVEKDVDELGWGMNEIRGEVRGWRRRVPLPHSAPFEGYGYCKPSI